MIWLIAQLAIAQPVLDPAPVVGGESAITVVDDLSQPVISASVRVVHRPGLVGERELSIGLTDSRGTVYWTPEHAGPARLRAGSTPVLVHVARDQAPIARWILLGALGALILVLIGYGAWPARRPPRSGAS